MPLYYSIIMAIQGTYRTFSVSLPLDLAEKAEAIAAKESLSTSDVLGEALRSFFLKKENASDFLRRAGEYADGLDTGIVEADVDRLIHEFRAEQAASSNNSAER